LEIAFNRKVKINFISKIIRRPITIMVHTYWQIGKCIVEQEQQGNSRASYGDFVVSGLSKYLSDASGKGFSEVNLRNMWHFYQNLPDLD